MNLSRANASATILNGYIYIAGGVMEIGDEYIPTDAVELYDPKTDEWTKVAPMNQPRSNFALIAWNGFLYALGGDAIVERFHPFKNGWTMVCESDAER